MEGYCVVVADVVGSRRLTDWHLILESIRSTYERINTEFSSEIVADFSLTSGDEFQVALRSPAVVYDMLLNFTESLEVRVRFGIGMGHVERSGRDVLEMRGSAFYRARDAIVEAKKQGRNLFVKSSDRPSLFDRILNVLFYFVQTTEDDWTERQREIVTFYRSRRGLTYDEVGKHFGITKQSVSKTLKSANWNALNEGEETIRAILGKWNELVNHRSMTDESKHRMVYSEC